MNRLRNGRLGDDYFSDFNIMSLTMLNIFHKSPFYDILMQDVFR